VDYENIIFWYDIFAIFPHKDGIIIASSCNTVIYTMFVIQLLTVI